MAASLWLASSALAGCGLVPASGEAAPDAAPTGSTAPGLSWAPAPLTEDGISVLARADADGFALTLKDSRYVADAKKQGLDVNPVSWQRMTEVITDSFTAPEALKAKLRQSVAYDKGSEKKKKKKKD